MPRTTCCQSERARVTSVIFCTTPWWAAATEITPSTWAPRIAGKAQRGEVIGNLDYYLGLAGSWQSDYAVGGGSTEYNTGWTRAEGAGKMRRGDAGGYGTCRAGGCGAKRRAEQIATVAQSHVEPTHPIQLLRRAYGI